MNLSIQSFKLARLAAFIVATGLICSSAFSADPDFYRDVYPFLKTNCISCHNKTTTKADLNMETPALMIKGGDSGPSIIPGDSTKSLVVEASKHQFDMEMPPKNNKTDAANLTPGEIKVLKIWIDQGAKDSVKQERKVVWQPPAPGVHPIYTLAMTEEGRFAACGRSNQIFVYDLATRQFATQIVDSAEKPAGAHRGLVHSLAFSPDGTRLASGGFREVKIWRQEKSQPVKRKADPALGLVVSVMTADGSKIIGADKTGAILVLNAADGKVIRKIPGAGPKGIKLLSVSPDASKVAVFAEGWNMNIWNLADGKLLAKQDTPNSQLEKQSKDAQARFAAATKAEGAAIAAKAAATKEDLAAKTQVAKTALTKKVAAEKIAKDTAAKVTLARKVAVRALTWTSDSKAVALAGADKLVSIWSLPALGNTAFAAPKELKGARGTITALAAGPDRLISASEDNRLRVWSISQAKIVKEISSAGITSLALSPDGKQLVTGGVDSAIRVWDLASGKQNIELRGSVAVTRQVGALDWSIARQALEQAFQTTVVNRISAQEKALDILLKKANDAIVAMNKALPVKEKAVKPVKDALAVAQKAVDAAAAVIAKAPDGKPTAAMEKAHKTAQDKLITAKTAETSALAAFKAVQSNITDAQAQVKSITATKAKNSKDSAAAKTSGEAAKKIQTKANADLAVAKKTLAKAVAKPLAVAFSADGQKVAAISNDGTIYVWAVATGTPIDQIAGTASTAVSLIPRANGTFAACGTDAAFSTTAPAPRWVLDQVIGGEKDLSLFADRVNALHFSPDGKTLAIGGGEPSRTGDVTLFNLATKKPAATWENLHEDTVVSLDFSLDGKLLASGAADKIARVTNVATGKQVNLFEGHTHYVTDVSFRADGRVLATAGADGVVNAWDMLLGERKKKIEGWTKEVTSLQFIGATNRIITSAGDNLIRIVNDDGGQIRSITKLPDFMQAAASTPNGTTIIGGGEHSFLRVWNGTDGKEVAAFGSK